VILVAAVANALRATAGMAWQIAWSLVLGFIISAVIESLVRKETISRLLADDRPRSLVTATGLGAASSSCSYAAVAMARSLVRKGADFTAAMAFQIASTNLVIELGVILGLLIGWRFTLAEFVGAPIMIVIVALMFRRFVSVRIVDAARTQADRGLAGSMEGHADMDMSVKGDGTFVGRLASADGLTAIAHNFVMEWAAILRDLLIGLFVAGAASAWIPASFWQHLFLTDHPVAAKIWGPVVGPLVAAATFVCSIGNVPLAAVLWNGGISFGGVMSFIFADLLIVPLLLIYRKYYGTRMTLVIAGTFYLAMVAAGYAIELVFTPLGLTGGQRNAQTGQAAITWNYTSVLDIVFGVVAIALVYRFFRTGGGPMLAMMSGGASDAAGHGDQHGHTT